MDIDRKNGGAARCGHCRIAQGRRAAAKRLDSGAAWTSWPTRRNSAITRKMNFRTGRTIPDAKLDRRELLKVMAASAAFAGLTGCTKLPTQKIVPYVRQPEEIIPGKPLFYATAVTLGGVATGVLVESHMARPTKIEGNPDHPGSLGATDAFAQASILGLYDPDRSQAEIHDGRIGSWAEFQDELSTALGAEKGGRRRRAAAADADDHFSDARRSNQHVLEGLSVREVGAVRIGDARQCARRRETRLRRIREHGLPRGSART